MSGSHLRMWAFSSLTSVVTCSIRNSDSDSSAPRSTASSTDITWFTPGQHLYPHCLWKSVNPLSTATQLVQRLLWA